MPASPAPSAVRGASAAPPMSARAPGLEPPPAACASRTAEGAPPAPDVSVLIMAAGFAGPVGAGRTDPRSEGPIAAADSSGPLDEEVLALVRACTGADPFLCSPSDGPARRRRRADAERGRCPAPGARSRTSRGTRGTAPGYLRRGVTGRA